ncbi:ABC transporter substrate-binding protein [Nonomuraea polychroma]|uniref:ABC transporter substrate-binding protein n=1 Tax=Nonomuraea polychroma TaxID=46176 RepID=UPI003D916F0D
MKRTRSVTIFLLIVLMAGCSRLTPTASTPSENTKLTTITVGIMQIPETATLQVAMDGGYFTREGLSVKTRVVQGGGPALPLLYDDTLQFAIMNYVTGVQEEAETPGKLKFATDAYQAGPNTFQLMVAKNSSISTPADLRGQKIGVATLNSISTLTTEVVLAIHGLTKHDVQWAIVPIPEMIKALDEKKIAAAWMTEPFITDYGRKGGRLLYDVMTGPLDRFPIAGWATSGEYAKNHLKEVAAFQRAMQRAQVEVALDRGLVSSALPKYTRIPPEAATIITLGEFPTSLHPNRISRVVDQMLEMKYLKDRVNVASMLLPLPSPAPAALSSTTQHRQGLAS